MEAKHIIIQQPQEDQVISLEQVIKRRASRRRRVAKRMWKRFPMFAAEFMQDEFPEVDQETVVAEVSKKSRKGKSYRRKKNPLKRQGRYPAMMKALYKYHETGDTNYLAEAQRLRNNISKPFLFQFRLGQEIREYQLPSTTGLGVVKEIAAMKFSNWEEFESKWKEATKWCHIS